MKCEEIVLQIETYIDGELTLSDRRDIEEHLSDCSTCNKKVEVAQLLQQQVRSVEYKNMPSNLKINIQNKLRDLTGEETKKSGLFKWLGIGGGAMATGSFATWMLMTFVFFSPLNTQLADAIISSHISALMVDHATDIKNSDKHTVKPWFNGRVDFSPQVKDLSDKGFIFIGGRLDYLQGKTVSALVYKRRAHIINAFIFKAEDNTTTSPTSLQRHGYNLIFWKKNGLHYWLISDLNKKELDILAQLTYAS